jgi:uncharacterized glyoxalase superfamily protein PhnB
MDFLVAAFGAEQHAVNTTVDGTIRHAEFRLGNGIVMFGPASDRMPAPRGRGGGIYVVITDPDEHCARARAAGAEIVMEPHDTDYGSRNYAAKDPEGNAWFFGTYQPFAFDHESERAEVTG